MVVPSYKGAQQRQLARFIGTVCRSDANDLTLLMHIAPLRLHPIQFSLS